MPSRVLRGKSGAGRYNNQTAWLHEVVDKPADDLSPFPTVRP